jgi:uncharacterized OsmC-like protein
MMTEVIAPEVIAPNLVNGLNLDALAAVAGEVQRDPSEGLVRFAVRTEWAGQTRSRSTVSGYELAGERIPRNFTIEADEPEELLGTNTAPNPQELLMSAVNACMMVGYVAGASLHGIKLHHVEIETTGQLDLRGFLGLDESVPPGYEQVDYTVRIAGEGTPEQFQEIHRTVMQTSPNYFNLARPIRMNGKLELN